MNIDISKYEEKRGNEGKDTGKLHEATRGTKWGRGEFDRGLSEVTV